MRSNDWRVPLQQIPRFKLAEIVRGKIAEIGDSRNAPAEWIRAADLDAVLRAIPPPHPEAEADVIEAVAAWDHEAWAGWMRHLFAGCRVGADGTGIIPRDSWDRWMRQALTPYDQLSEAEKESDRKEARGVLAVVAKFPSPLPAAPPAPQEPPA